MQEKTTEYHSSEQCAKNIVMERIFCNITVHGKKYEKNL